MSVRYFERITATQLAEMLRSPSAPRPLIIDVRDSDFAGGHIRSAVNLPEDNFISDDDVDAIVTKYKDEEMIVFHCMLSQVRGPSCARRFLNRMIVVLADQEKKLDVRVLTGGYQNFLSVSVLFAQTMFPKQNRRAVTDAPRCTRVCVLDDDHYRSTRMTPISLNSKAIHKSQAT